MNAPLHITFIDNVCDPSQPGRSGHSDIIWEVSRHLLSAGHHVNIVADYTAPSPYAHENLEVLGFKARPFDRRNGLGKIVHVLRAYRRAARTHTDLFFTTDAFSAGVTAGLSRCVPVIFMTPANIYQRQASGYKLDPMAEAFYRFVSFYAARRSAHIVATSHDLKGWWLRTGALAEKVSVIPLGTEAQLFAAPRRAPKGPLRLLYVARFEGDNNPHMLVALAQQLKARGVAFILNAVGAGTLLEQVKAETVKAGLEEVVHFHGHVSYQDLPAVYADNDVFVFTREAGGPPRVVIQALASGLAVVAFNSSGLEDYLDSGTSGFLVPNGSVSKLVDKVAQLAGDRALLQSVQACARARIQKDFDWRAVTARYLELFSTLFTPQSREKETVSHTYHEEKRVRHG